MDCSPSSSSVHGVLQARIQKHFPILGSSFLLQGIFLTQVSCIAGRVFTIWATREAQKRAGCSVKAPLEMNLGYPVYQQVNRRSELVGKSWFKSHLWHLLLMRPGFSWCLSVIKGYLLHKVMVKSKLIKHVSTVHRVTKSQTQLKRLSVRACVLVKLQWDVLHDMYRVFFHHHPAHFPPHGDAYSTLDWLLIGFKLTTKLYLQYRPNST